VATVEPEEHLMAVNTVHPRGVTLCSTAMNPPLHHRNLWSLDALSRTDVLALLDMAHALKRANAAGSAQRPLRGKNLAVLSDKTADGKSSDFQRAATELGAQVAHVRPGESRIEGASHAARLLGRLYDAIDCEGLDAATLQQIDREAGVPVFNGLADDAHPTRVFATLLDLQDRSGRPLSSLRVAFLGDPRTPRGDALLQAAALTGMELRIGAPHDAWPAAQRLEHAKRVAQDTGARLLLLESTVDATKGADFVLDERNGSQAATADDQRYALQAVLLSTLA
jgi:ornithine carbamoyltransferase